MILGEEQAASHVADGMSFGRRKELAAMIHYIVERASWCCMKLIGSQFSTVPAFYGMDKILLREKES